jgi:hypothetical protein
LAPGKWQRVSRIALWTLLGGATVLVALFFGVWWLVQPGGLLHDAAVRSLQNGGFGAAR